MGEGRPCILTLTEPGMVGKIGMNENGVGVCLNALRGRVSCDPVDGIPVHCLVRMILACESLHEANALLHKTPQNCSCHLLLADAIGQYRMLEFSERALESAEWQVV